MTPNPLARSDGLCRSLGNSPQRLLASKSERSLKHHRKRSESSSALETSLFLKQLNSLVSPPSSPRDGSPRLLARAKTPSNIVSQLQASSKYTDIASHVSKLLELQILAKFDCSNEINTWNDQKVVLNADDIAKAITKLQKIIDESWERFITLLFNWKIDRTSVMNAKSISLTNIHGLNIEITLLKRLEEGGYHIPFLAKENEKECILLVAKEGAISNACDSRWTTPQIESILWRENATQLLTSFFPAHLHTFVLAYEEINLPTACYLIEKLNPVKDKSTFCLKLIQLLEKFQDGFMIHGDIKPSNVMATSEDEPRFIDLDFNCFVDFAAFGNMSAADTANQWQRIRDAGTTSLFSPPQFHSTLIDACERKDLNQTFALLKAKDRYGLGLTILEIMTSKPIDELEKGNVLSESTFGKIKNSLEESAIHPRLQAEIIESIQAGFNLQTAFSRCH